jgi:hypothetical protein
VASFRHAPAAAGDEPIEGFQLEIEERYQRQAVCRRENETSAPRVGDDEASAGTSDFDQGARRALSIGEGQRHCAIMRQKRSEGESAPMTLGQALAAKVRVIVWCKGCGHRPSPT